MSSESIPPPPPPAACSDAPTTGHPLPPLPMQPPLDPLIAFALRQAGAATSLVERVAWFAAATRERRVAEAAMAQYIEAHRPTPESQAFDRLSHVLQLGFRFWQEHMEYRARALHEARRIAEEAKRTGFMN